MLRAVLQGLLLVVLAVVISYVLLFFADAYLSFDGDNAGVP